MRVRCPHCRKTYKNEKGLRIHLANNSTCRLRRETRERYKQGFIAENKNQALASICLELGHPLEARNPITCWIPTWLVQLIRTFGIRTYDGRTPVHLRHGPMRLNTPRLQEEYLRAKDDASAQASLALMYLLDRKWNSYVVDLLKRKVRVSEEEWASAERRLRVSRSFAPVKTEESEAQQ